jgi:menaquinone-dependent protoporphyrinogen IX oxidase
VGNDDFKDVISMRALVVYESMYGNTHLIASNVADVLRGTYDVTLVPVGEATADLIAGADLLVVGAPTHMHGMSTASSRQTARKAAAKPDSGLTLDPDAGGPALRDWLGGLAGGNRLAAAFDTRLAGSPMMTGRASRRISKLLTRHGYRLIVPPQSFVVTRLNTLADGESSRARRWGETLAAAVGLDQSPVGS